MKKSYPVEVAEYAEAVGMSDKPAFSWWTTDVLKKKQNHSSQQEIPQDDTQIWDQGAQNCGGRLWTRKMGMTYGGRQYRRK